MEAMAHADLDAAPIVLNACPMVHGTGLFTFLFSVSCGAPMVMVERFDPDAVLDRIEQHGCTSILGLPFMYDALLEHQRKQPRKVGIWRGPRAPPEGTGKPKVRFGLSDGILSARSES